MSTIITKRQFPNYRKYEMELAGRPLFLEVGKLAELANAAVMVGYGPPRGLVRATASPRPRAGDTPDALRRAVRLDRFGSIVRRYARKRGYLVIRKTALLILRFKEIYILV